MILKKLRMNAHYYLTVMEDEVQKEYRCDTHSRNTLPTYRWWDITGEFDIEILPDTAKFCELDGLMEDAFDIQMDFHNGSGYALAYKN